MIHDFNDLPLDEMKLRIEKEAEKAKLKQKQLELLFESDDFCDSVLEYAKGKKIEQLAQEVNYMKSLVNLH